MTLVTVQTDAGPREISARIQAAQPDRFPLVVDEHDPVETDGDQE